MVVTYDQYINITLADILFSDIIVVSYNFLINKRYLDLHSKKSVDYVYNNFKGLKDGIYYWENGKLYDNPLCKDVVIL